MHCYLWRVEVIINGKNASKMLKKWYPIPYFMAFFGESFGRVVRHVVGKWCIYSSKWYFFGLKMARWCSLVTVMASCIAPIFYHTMVHFVVNWSPIYGVFLVLNGSAWYQMVLTMVLNGTENNQKMALYWHKNCIFIGKKLPIMV